MNITEIAEGLNTLFPKFHIKSNMPIEHIFDLKTEDVLATFFILENIEYQKFLYVKYDFKTEKLSECYPTLFGSVQESIDYLNVCDSSKPVKDRQTYFSLPIKFENGQYQFDYQDSYSTYYPQKDNRTIVRKLNGNFEMGYYQITDLGQASFPLYWKTRDLIINSESDYMIFYFNNENMKSPIKINLGYNVLNRQYKDLSRFHMSVKNTVKKLKEQNNVVC